MPAYRFSGRRYRRYRRYRRFYRRFRRGYARRYVNASSRSSVRMKTTIDAQFNCTAGYGASGTGALVDYSSPLAGTGFAMSLANSPLFRTYCNLYEEMKIVGCKINLAIVSAVGGSDIPSLQIYTCWDRKFGQGEAAPNINDIKNSATYNVATALNNNVAKLSRSIYASDLMEKATWFDSTLDTAANGYQTLAWVAAGLNPNMFHPSFAFAFVCPSKGATTAVSVSVSVTYYCAFRNPRYGGSGGSAKLIDLGGVVRASPDDDDGDMDADDAAAVLPLDDEDDLSAPVPMTRRARSNASSELQSSAAPAARRVRVSEPKN